MKRMKQVKQMKALEKLLLSFLLVLIIPFAAYGISYRQTSRIVMEKTQDYTFAMLEQMREILDNKWDQFDSITYNLNRNPKIKSYIHVSLPMPDSRYYSLWDIQNAIQPYSVTDDFIHEIGVYFVRSDRLVMTQQVLALQELYEGYFSQVEGLSDFGMFTQRLARTTAEGSFFPAVTLTAEGREAQALPYVKRIPPDYSNNTDGYIFFFLSVDGLRQLLQQVDVFKQGNVYVTDGEEIIWSVINNDDITLSGGALGGTGDFLLEGDTITAYISSKSRDWKYCIKLPNNVLMDNVRYLKESNLILAIVTFAVAGCVAAVLSVRSTKPITQMVDTVSAFMRDNAGGKMDEFGYLERSFQSLMENNSRMEQTLQRQHPLLKNEFLDNLFRGEYGDEKEIQEVLQDIGLSISGKTFLVLLVSVSGQDPAAVEEASGSREARGGRMLLADMLEAGDGTGQLFSSFTEKDKVAVLLCSGKGDDNSLRDKAQGLAASVRGRMMRELGLSVSFFGGSLCRELKEASASFSNARFAYDAFWDSEEKRDIYWYSDNTAVRAVHQYPLDTQVKLVNLTSAGKEEEVQALLEEVFRGNFTRPRQPQLPHQEKVQLLIEMRGTLLKLYEKFRLDYSLFHIYVEDCSQGSPEVFGHMVQYFTSLCRIANQLRDDKSQRLKGSVVSYIKAQYRDPSLSLASLCDQFSMGEVAMSQFFKNATGETLSQFIETLRIEDACGQLLQTGKSVQEIALEVGYNNDKSFRRAFKRIKGVSPTEFRRSV